MADCFVVAMGGSRLLVKRVGAVEDGIFLAQVLVSTPSVHFNKLPEVKMDDRAPISVNQADVVHDYAVIDISEWVCGPFPAGKSKGKMMYHAGMERVAAISDVNFPLMREVVGGIYIPLVNEVTIFRNIMVSYIHKAFKKRGSALRTGKVPCTFRVWHHMVHVLKGQTSKKRGTKHGTQHIMNRCSSILISTDIIAMKCYSLIQLQEFFGKKMCSIHFVLDVLLLFFINNVACINVILL
jgi:hypothetical protein